MGLTFGYKFNQSLDNIALPGSLQTLTFSHCFNQSLDNVALPGTLQTLTFGDLFNQSLDNVALPGTLQALNFSPCFNQCLDNVAIPAACRISAGEISCSRVTVYSSLHIQNSLVVMYIARLLVTLAAFLPRYNCGNHRHSPQTHTRHSGF